jgi:2-methylisocitrate lyase-like PEP mutase family enzyme
MDLASAAARLRSLHHGPEPLILPNAWDAASARAVVAAGFPVVATSSVAVAEALGYADGEQTPADEMFWAIGRIARAVDAPLTADVESGYGLSPEQLVAKLLAAGAVGCNLEDTDHRAGGGTLVAAEAHADRVAAVKRVGQAAGVDIVVNARADVFLHGTGEVAEALRRGRLYLAAGADCFYPIGAADEATIAALVQGVAGPINVIPGFRGAPGLQRLRDLGVRRISYAGRLFRAAQVDHQRRLAAIRAGEEF